jgi:hypothetical protein
MHRHGGSSLGLDFIRAPFRKFSISPTWWLPLATEIRCGWGCPEGAGYIPLNVTCLNVVYTPYLNTHVLAYVDHDMRDDSRIASYFRLHRSGRSQLSDCFPMDTELKAMFTKQCCQPEKLDFLEHIVATSVSLWRRCHRESHGFPADHVPHYARQDFAGIRQRNFSQTR